MRRKVGVFVSIFLLSLIITLFTHLNVLCAEIGSFHITAKDLNLLNLESLLEKHFPGVKYDGKISLSADIKLEKGLETVSRGTFSSDKASFFSENFLFPLEFSQLEGEFMVNAKESSPVIAGKIKSAAVKWGKLPAQDLEADYSLYEKNLVIKNGEIKIAGGTAYVNGDIDFGKNPAVFNLKLTTQGVDIGIISQLWGYMRPMSGILFSDANLSGEFGKPAGIFGKAKINIEKGELGKVGLVGRILTFSPLAAMSRDFSLDTFDGDFNISEGYAYTENAALKGPEIRITAKGDVGLNKKLNFLLELHASSEPLNGTSLTRTLGTIIDNFGNILRRIRLSGTIDNPSFTIVPLGIGETIVEGLERSFGKGQQGEDIK
jgi:uncharacterized protein involved in outer membrane biogenesis